MEDRKNYTKINRILKIGIIVLSTLTIVILISNKSYSLFNNVITTKPIITIKTDSELPSQGPSLIKIILDKAYTNTGELVAIDKNSNKCSSLENCDVREYRFIGPSVNNYIYLKSNLEKDELWRIIGVFNDDEAGQYIKIVREYTLPSDYIPATFKGTNNESYSIQYSSSDQWRAYWNQKSGSIDNNWATAGLQYYLNVEQDSDGVNGFLSYLSNDTKSKLVAVKHYLGTVHTNSSSNDTPKTAYNHERDVENCIDNKGLSNNNSTSAMESENSGCHIWSGNDATWTGKVALMYPSDYGLSASESYWSVPLGGTSSNNFNDSTVNSNTWMMKTISSIDYYSSWMLSPSSEGPNYATYWDTGYNHYYTPPTNIGGIVGMEVGTGPSLVSTSQEKEWNVQPIAMGGPADRGVRPVVYIGKKAVHLDGDGTATSPYKILSD